MENLSSPRDTCTLVLQHKLFHRQERKKGNLWSCILSSPVQSAGLWLTLRLNVVQMWFKNNLRFHLIMCVGEKLEVRIEMDFLTNLTA